MCDSKIKLSVEFESEYLESIFGTSDDESTCDDKNYFLKKNNEWYFLRYGNFGPIDSDDEEGKKILEELPRWSKKTKRQKKMEMKMKMKLYVKK